MIGKFYIDDIDVFTNYGVFVCGGGYKGVVSQPPLKKVESNDWAEDDGMDVDLLSTALDSKEFSIDFASVNSIKTGEFLDMLSNGAYHEFDFKELGVTRKLRLVSQPSKSTLLNLELFSLQFADDFPLDRYVYEVPMPIVAVRNQGYLIDDVYLSDYGVIVLRGTYDEVFKSPDVKKNLIVSIDSHSGAIYDRYNAIFQAKDSTIKCLLRASSLGEFWRNYNALLFDLTRPGERQLRIESTDEYFDFYYKSSQVSSFGVLSGDVWCEFSLNLVFTSFRPGQIESLLTSEDDKIIVTEKSIENRVEFVNLKRYEDR